MKAYRIVGLLVVAGVALRALPLMAAEYYVRQTVGDDRNDGHSAATAWATVKRLGSVMRPGDTAYVGPGLYREEINLMHSGAREQPITFVADTTGKHTGDPPGVVMFAGSDPVDETIFEPAGPPGVYRASFPKHRVLGVVEMDGDQRRYVKVTTTAAHLVDKLTPLEAVAKLPSTFYYDDEAKTLHLHTSDGRPPRTHEMEIFRRLNGIAGVDRHYVTVVGFTFRHMGDAGISFFTGCSHGTALHNVSYGSRQGIRVYAATDILAAGNTLFRNENSGIYMAKGSTGGRVLDNVLYENIKGARWSSESVNAVCADNVSFDNYERGLSFEDVTHVVVRGNRLVNNAQSQILNLTSTIDSEDNCFAPGRPEQPLVEWLRKPYRALEDYRRATGQDIASRTGDCGPLPEKIDVHRLHAETQEYAERARKMLAAKAAASPPAPGPSGEAPPPPPRRPAAP